MSIQKCWKSKVPLLADVIEIKSHITEFLNRAGDFREYAKYLKNSVYLNSANSTGHAKYIPISHVIPSFRRLSTCDGNFTVIFETDGLVAGYV